MARNASVPEQLFLRAVFEEQLPERCLASLFSKGRQAAVEELRSEIAAALSQLSYRERGILEMRFGLGDGYAYTLAQAGQVFRLTRERIRQIQAKALRKVRERGTGLRDFVARVRR